MKKLIHLYINLSLAFLLLACSVSVKAQLYGSSDANGSYGTYGGGDEQSSQSPSGGNEQSSQSPSGGNEQSSQSPSKENEQSSQSPSGGNEQSSQSPSGGNEQSSQSANQGGGQGSDDGSSASVYGAGSGSDDYGYDANGSGGSYGGSGGDNSGSYGSPSAAYGPPSSTPSGFSDSNESSSPSQDSSSGSSKPNGSSSQSQGSSSGSSKPNKSTSQSQGSSSGSPKSNESSNSSQGSSSGSSASNKPSNSSSVSSNAQTSTPTNVFPPSRMTTFAVDIHFVAGYDLRSSYIAFHYCSGAPNVTQCAIYNGQGSNALLIAVEMVVSEEVFKTFPEEERQLWHSHEFPVTSGIFVLPELSPEEELKSLQTVISTYGKVTNFYHPGTSAPTGPPALAYGWTREDQVNEKLVQRMDQILNLTTTRAERQKARESLKRPTLVPGHDEYLETGFINEYDLFAVQVNEEGEPIE